MALLNQQIQEILKKPVAKPHLLKAIKHENRLRFHTEEAQSEHDAGSYLADFKGWVKQILPADKFKMFEVLMRFPLYTNELIKAISEEYMKVYDSQNSSFTYEFSNEQHESDFKQYLVDTDFWSNWKDESFEAMMKAINSIVVVDMPSEISEETKPYYYMLNIDNVVDLGYTKKGQIEWLLAKQEPVLIGEREVERILFIDETRYAVFYKDKDIITEVLSSQHELGYAPACFFWKTPIKRGQPIIKKAPVTSALSNLDWLLFFEVSRRMFETYGVYPILTSYKESCTNYKVEDGIQYGCENGRIALPTGSVECEACAKSKLIGPGTHFKVKPPTSKDSPDNLEAVKVITMDKDALEYAMSRADSLWDEIYYDCVGSGGDEMTNQAKNEKQIKAGFETKQNILMTIKENLEYSGSFIVATMARLRYGSSFLGNTFNLGTDFYLKSPSEAVGEYKDSKLAGVPMYQLAYKRSQIDAISTKGNDHDSERLNILKNIEPWIDLSLGECKSLGLDLSSPDLFYMKSDFSRLILRFEGEYGSIIEFGKLIDFKTKIDRIKTVLLKYVKEDFKPVKPETKTEKV